MAQLGLHCTATLALNADQSNKCTGPHADANECIVGTMDLVCDHSASGEVMQGTDANAMYMINVCVADIARRRGVGQKLVTASMECAQQAGAHHHHL